MGAKERNARYCAKPEKKKMRYDYKKAWRIIPENKARERANRLANYKLRPPLTAAKKLEKKSYFLKWRYGLSLEAYNLLLCLQRFACAICGEKPNGSHRNAGLHVDHNHNTGEVRGLLCGNCNVGIGHLRNNHEAAISYLAG